jgi:hypothetical protein
MQIPSKEINLFFKTLANVRPVPATHHNPLRRALDHLGLLPPARIPTVSIVTDPPS